MKYQYPVCPKKPVTEERFGITIQDDYRNLENPQDPEVLAWVAAENAYTDAWFDQEEVQKRIARLQELKLGPAYDQVKEWAGGFLCLKTEEGIHSVVFRDADFRNEKVLLAKYDIPDFVPWFAAGCPNDDRLIAVLGNYDGKARPTHIIMDAQTKEILAQVGNGFAGDWDPAGKRYWYTRTDVKEAPEAGGGQDGSPSASISSVWFYDVETGEEVLVFEDSHYSVFADQHVSPDDLVIEVMADYSHSYFYACERTPDAKEPGGELFLTAPLCAAAREMTYVGTAAGRRWFIDKEEAATGALIAIPLGEDLAARELVLPGDPARTLESGFCLGGKVYLITMENVASRLYRLDLATPAAALVAIPLPSAMGAAALLGQSATEAFLMYESFTEAPRVLGFDGEKTRELYRAAETDYDELVCEQLWAKTAAEGDETLIPYYMIRRPDAKPEGNAPVLMYAYGGYNVSEMPGYVNRVTSLRVGEWVRAGGIYVHVSLRGGSEFGTAWHEGGMLMKKKNCYYDFIGVTEKLIADGWSQPARIAISGLSNGGLMVSALMTMRPDLFGCVIDSVPHTDMVRFAEDDRGHMYITEYGDPHESREMLAYFLSYSPYHNVRPVAYPPVYIQTGECDNNVPPYHGKKFAARVQELNTSENPVLFRVLAKGSHDRGSGAEYWQTAAEMQIFLEKALGML